MWSNLSRDHFRNLDRQIVRRRTSALDGGARALAEAGARPRPGPARHARGAQTAGWTRLFAANARSRQFLSPRPRPTILHQTQHRRLEKANPALNTVERRDPAGCRAAGGESSRRAESPRFRANVTRRRVRERAGYCARRRRDAGGRGGERIGDNPLRRLQPKRRVSPVICPRIPRASLPTKNMADSPGQPAFPAVFAPHRRRRAIGGGCPAQNAACRHIRPRSRRWNP